MFAIANFSAEFIDRVSAVVRRRAGLVFDLPRRPVLETGVRTAMGRANSRNPEQYLARLDHERALFDDLLAEITIGETYFFRDVEQFALLRERIIPDLIRRRGNRTDGVPLRLWSAGCASGEEPYSLAILLHQFGCLAGAQLLGTDVSLPALRQARQARYSRWSLRGVSEELITTYFHRSGDRFTLIPAIRGTVDFRYLNLADTEYPSLLSGAWGMDLILCRNVLIYVAADRVAEIAQRLLDSLADDGWLLLGSADPLLTELIPCSAEITPAGLAYRRGGRGSSKLAAVSVLPRRLPVATPSSPPPSPPGRTKNESTRPIEMPETRPRVEPSPASDTEAAAEAARFYSAREYRSAADAATHALATDADDATVWILLINALVNCGAFGEAETKCREARDRHGLCAELTSLHAFVLLEAGHHREAAMTARQALYLNPGLSVAHLALGTALLRARDASGAERAFRNAERLLAALPSDSPVPGAGDEPAGRLVELARTQLALLRASFS